ncbi:putative signal transduction protein with CBS domains [Solidesulfovibrio fructosivorans JJ]]|uniref:Putative signal transduction protein with CBS domains n=1 Tax=Solidesulfovibrio fructosivorans JJ] TaxID=596151 RepID=E1K2L5_SOLFR|nr:CBS domain-containing protein [Solidesulfovibrio fructosivorans]EFL49147.1 putative signal transduction protein with CBS domains [Solidesulfovibrio fructosivorans JJ]]
MFKHRVGELAKRPHIVAAEASITQAADLMAREGISCLAAVSGAKVVGFLTENNIVRHFDVDMDLDASIREFLTKPEGAVAKDLPVSEAVKLLLERAARHLPVVDFSGSLLGLVTEKELVDALAVDFMVEDALCSDLMHHDPVTLPADRTVREALTLMREKNADCVMAVDAGKPAGILSERDVLSRVLGYPERLAAPVTRYMTTPVISVPTTAVIYKVILFMRQKGVRRVAVIHEDGRLAGLLSQRDLLRYARRIGL